MRTDVLKRCELFVENRTIIKSVYHCGNFISPLCAILFAGNNILVDSDILKECNDLLVRETNVFSNFRGIIKPIANSYLALSDNREQMMQQFIDNYAELKLLFGRSEFVVATAIVIAQMGVTENLSQLAKRTRSLYYCMKDNHPFLTGKEDCALAAILALSNKVEEAIIDEMERCYSILKKEFTSRNAIQSLSHVLALKEQSAEEKCERVIGLYNALCAKGLHYGKNYELATLGVLALVDVDLQVLVNDIAEVDAYLATQKGFGVLGIGKQRLVYAGMLVAKDYVLDTSFIQEATALNSTVALVIAQQVALSSTIAMTIMAANSNT